MYTDIRTATVWFIGLSTEEKPSLGLPADDRTGAIETGARLTELDTGREFRYYETAWHEVPTYYIDKLQKQLETILDELKGVRAGTDTL